MKKFLAILIALALVAMLPLTAFAATGINEYEQKVLDKLAAGVKLSNGETYKIPQAYINTAKNYFAGDCDMTQGEANDIIALINEGIAIVKAEASKNTGSTFDLKSLPTDAKEEILALGQKACSEIGLQLTYNGRTDEVSIKDASGAPVFENSAVIKTTGQAVTVDAAFVCAIVVVCMTLAAGAMFVVSKKNGLLEK